MGVGNELACNNHYAQFTYLCLAYISYLIVYISSLISK